MRLRLAAYSLQIEFAYGPKVVRTSNKSF